MPSQNQSDLEAASSSGARLDATAPVATATGTAPAGDAPSTRTFFGHPWGLANLFGVEMWERFSFYGMQALLAFYLYYSATDGGLGMTESEALSIVGAYGGLVYMMALVASFVADRVLGAERTLLYSAVTVMAGHIVLAIIPGILGLSLGLILIGVGSGGVKTSASVVLGDMYAREDPKRDAGFSIFYMGVNIGALFGPMITGEVWKAGGFHWGFGLAAIGMAAGLIQYMLMRNSTIGVAGHEVPSPISSRDAVRYVIIALAVVVLVIVLLATGIVKVDWLSTITAIVAAVAAIYLMIQMYRSEYTTEAERSRLIAFIPLFVGGVLFFAIFQSQFTVLAVYSDQRLNRHFLGMDMAPSQVQLFNPLFIIIFSAIFATLWTKLGDRQPSTALKFGLANIIIGASMFFFLPYAGGGENSTPMIVIIWILFLFTMGELLLSPVGNSLATKVAPAAYKSRMMAVWLMAVAMGTALSGTLGGMYDSSNEAAERTFFIAVGAAAIVLGVILIALKGWVRKRLIDVL